MSENEEQSLRAGTRFGRYQIVRRIGRGGMGAVYEALHVELSKKVAIKALLAPLSENTELRARFLREGQAASRIRHPHVVDIYDVGTHRGITFLVMEFLEGEELAQRLRRQGALSIEETVSIVLPVCAAISAAHEDGVIHRDLKPANIFLSRDRYGDVCPKVVDFGISKRIDDGVKDALTNTGALMGTPYYMSPEAATGDKAIDARADQYAIGVILYQCLTGKRPIEGDTMYAVLRSIVEGAFAPPRALKPELPASLENVVLRAMRNKPGDRYPTVRALGEALYPFGDAATRARWQRQFETSNFEGSQRNTELVPSPLEMTPAAPPREAMLVGDTPLVGPNDQTLTPIGTLVPPEPPASPPAFTMVHVALVLLTVAAIALGIAVYLKVQARSVVILPEPKPVLPVQVAPPVPVPAPAPVVEPVVEPVEVVEPAAPAVIEKPKPAAPKPPKRVVAPKRVQKGTNEAPIIE